MKKKLELIDSLSLRKYQESLISNTLTKNTLVVLPTGLGKTIIALMTSFYYWNKYNKKILFLAPTKPLVEQQCKSFMSFFKNASEFKFKVITGQIQPKKREEVYLESDFIFATPQLIENDIINKRLVLNEFSHIIFDEAHRATGNYSYVFIADEAFRRNVNILALTASPGISVEDIEEILNNLHCQNIQVKKYEDEDVKPFVNDISLKYVEVELDEELKNIKKNLEITLKYLLKELNLLGIKIDHNNLTKKFLLDLQKEIRIKISNGQAEQEDWKIISLIASIMKLLHGIEIFESQDLNSSFIFFNNFFRDGGDNTKASETLKSISFFKKAYLDIKKLKEIVEKYLLENNFKKKIIIFSQFRDVANSISSNINTIKGVKSKIFIGQSKKGDYGLSQKEQKKIIDDFKEDKFNILVSTSVGEEGLDIPKVDLVIFYEPIPSAIRSIQRLGRTGRFNRGEAIILITKGTREVITRHIANAKEKKMYKSLDLLIEKKRLDKNKEENNLLNFISNNEKKNDLNNFNNSINLEGSNKKLDAELKKTKKEDLIYIDSRENSDLIKKLHKLEGVDVESKNLESGDIVISYEVGIERKTKKDFVESILDKRLFPQLINLARNFSRPILIIEGDENIFSIRNLNPNVIRSTLASISIDLRIPIIYTSSIDETSNMILTILKRIKKKNSGLPNSLKKKSFSNSEELEKFLSSIPKINFVIAKNILSEFGTVENIVNAKIDDLKKIKGVGELRAKYIYNFFRRNYNNNLE